MSLEPSLTLNWVELPQGTFTATVVRGRATFTVTPRMFFSGIAQYNSTARSVGSNLRLRWEYLPGSELFVVYTDDYDSDAARGNAGAAQSRARRQGQSTVPAVAASAIASGSSSDSRLVISAASSCSPAPAGTPRAEVDGRQKERRPRARPPT